MNRQEEIVASYFNYIEQHIEDVVEGKCAAFLELNQIAAALNISHVHLTDIVQKQQGHHPCYFYDLKIIEKAQYYLEKTDWTVARIALTFTYDPSNFSKFFKKWTGKTPLQFRKNKT